MYWLEFIFSSVLIVAAGVRLTKYADALSDLLGLGKLWIGIVLLGLVTSLPEAITSLSAVIQLDASDLAVGNIFGSNMFNPLLIVFLDIFYRQGAVADKIESSVSQNLAANYAVFLMLIAIFDIILGTPISLGKVSLSTFLIIGFYFLGMKQLAVAENASGQNDPLVSSSKFTPAQVWLNLFASSVVVIVGAIWLAKSADVIAVKTGLGRTFVGSIMLACVTSLPELVVTISAVRLGSLGLAIGNILGSNMTNIFILAVCSLFYKSGAMLSMVSRAHIFTGFVAIMMTFMVIVAINNKRKPVLFHIGIYSYLMMLVFLLGTVVLYKLR